MSNKIKHIQRSHKTYGKKGDIFLNFERNAFIKLGKEYQSKPNMFNLIASSFKNLFKRKQGR